MIITVTPNQFLTALAALPPERLAMENDVSDILLEDDTSYLLMEPTSPWFSFISADPNNPDWIELYSAKLIRVGDPLYVKVQLGLSYTSAEMLDLFNAAVQVPR